MVSVCDDRRPGSACRKRNTFSPTRPDGFFMAKSCAETQIELPNQNIALKLSSPPVPNGSALRRMRHVDNSQHKSAGVSDRSHLCWAPYAPSPSNRTDCELTPCAHSWDPRRLPNGRERRSLTSVRGIQRPHAIRTAATPQMPHVHISGTNPCLARDPTQRCEG